MDREEIWPEIRRAYAAKDFARCETLLAELPDTEATGLLRVRVAARRDRPEAVRTLAIAYLATHPPHLAVLQALGRAAHKLKDTPLAASAWRQVAELAPDPAEALRHTALAHARTGNDAFALGAAARLAAIADARPEALRIAAATLLDLGRFDALAALIASTEDGEAADIIASFADAGELRGLAVAHAELGETTVEALLDRAVQRECEGKLAEALDDFRATLAACPEDNAARAGVDRLVALFRHQAFALDRIGEFAEAIDSLRILYRTDPSDPEATLAYGAALMAEARYEHADDLWRTAIAAHPDFDEARRRLARTLDALDRPAEALEAWIAVHKRRPDDTEAGARIKALSQRLFTQFREALDAEDGVAAATRLLALPAGSAKRIAAEKASIRIVRLILKAMRRDFTAHNFARVFVHGGLALRIAPALLDVARLRARAASRGQPAAVALAAWEAVIAIEDGPEARDEIARLRAGPTTGDVGAVAKAAAT